jgi:hypothetical protein
MAKASNITRIAPKGNGSGSGSKPWTSEMAKLLVESMLAADSEIEIAEIIASNSHMSNSANWIPVARSENNIATVNNQSADPTKALCEMATNMLDAVLLRNAADRGIDPRSYDAPQSIAEAVETFFGWNEGRMTNAFKNMRAATAFADKNMIIAFTGSANKNHEPTLVFCDSGEGQHPQDFDRTFMSLGEGGGKRDIKFVQGQYNMGSSGVLGYCGDHGYKLVVSRKHTLDGNWGWSLVRRRPNYDRIVYEYFKVGGIDGEIPNFKAKSVDLVYDRNGQPVDGTTFPSGTAVKLFNYRIGAGYEDYDGPRRVFYEHLANPVLPIRILNVKASASDKKDKKRAAGVDARTFCGLEIHIAQALSGDDKAGNRDDSDLDNSPKGARVIDAGEINHPVFGRVAMKAFYTVEEITKTGKSEKGSGHGYIRSNNRAFYSVNGQIQHRDGRGFLTDCGFPALKDHMAIVIDCSNLTAKMHQTIWKADREAMLVGKAEVQKLIKEIKEKVATCEELKELNTEIQSQALSKMIDNSAQVVFSKLAKQDPTFAKLLTGGNPFPTAIRLQNEEQKPNAEPNEEPVVNFEGQYTPTFFALGGLKATTYRLQRGKSLTIQTKTDAVNDYFVRDKDRGSLKVSEELGEVGVATARETLRNGTLSVTFKAPNKAPLGSVPVTLTLRDPSMGRGVSLPPLQFEVVIVEPVAAPATERKKREKAEKKELQITTPSTKWQTRDGRDIDIEGAVEETHTWKEGWDERDGGYVWLTDDGKLAIELNYDNLHLQERLASTPPAAQRKIFEKFKIAMQLSCMATEQQINHLKATQPGIVTEEEIDRLRRNAAAVAASTALTLVDTLPKVMADKSDAAED